MERSLVASNVKNEQTIDVISQLLSLMLHLKGFAESEVSSYELKSLQDSLADTRKMVMADDPASLSESGQDHR